MKILLFQPSVKTPGIGDSWVNENQIVSLEKVVNENQPELTVLPELWPGYGWAMKRVSKLPCYSIVGTKRKDGDNIYNSVLLMRNEEVLAHYDKTLLWGSESKEFTPGKSPGIFQVDDKNFGVLICYDISEKNQRHIEKTMENSDFLSISAFADISYIDAGWETRPIEFNKKYSKPVFIANLGGLCENSQGKFGGGRSRVIDGEEKARLGNGEGWVLYDTESRMAKISEK